MSDHSEFKKLADAATQGPWFSNSVAPGDDQDEDPMIYRALPDAGERAISVLFNADWATDEDAAFVAACREAVPSLIADLEEAQLIGRITCNFDGYKAVLDERDQLKAEVEALKDQLENADELVVIREKQVKELFREREPMKKNADRYLWTTIEGNWVSRMFGKWRAHIGEYGHSKPTEWFDTREEAIDAAMGNGEKP